MSQASSKHLNAKTLRPLEALTNVDRPRIRPGARSESKYRRREEQSAPWTALTAEDDFAPSSAVTSLGSGHHE